jgi:hypothetical protein
VKARHYAIFGGLALVAAAVALAVRADLIPIYAQDTVVRIDPSAQQVNAGNQFTVRVMVDDVANLGSFEFTVQYDPNVVTYQSVARGDFLGSTGRQALCPGAIVDAGAGTVRFGCASIGAAPGASGSGQLAELTFNAVAEGASPLDLVMVSLSDPLSEDILAFPENGSVTVAVATPGPPTETPTPTLTPTPLPPCGDSSNTVVCIQPPGQVVENGSEFGVAVIAYNVTDLGSYQFSLQFDPLIMSYVSAANGPFLGSTGRQVQCNGPNLVGNEVRLVCVTLGSSRSGPNGDGLLATVTFLAQREGIGDLALNNLMLVDTQAHVLSMDDPVGASVVVVPGPTPTEGPSPTPSSTPTATETPPPTATFTPGPSPTPTPTRTPRPTWTPSPTPTPGPTPTSTPVPGPATIRIAPAEQEVYVGVPFTVGVEVDNVENLGAFEFTIGFDPSALEYVGAQEGPFLGSSGRASQCPSVEGFGGKVRMVCVTLGPEPAGPDGSGVLATVVFVPLNSTTTPIDITLDDAILVDLMAHTMASTTQGGSVTISPAPNPTETPVPTGTFTPGPSPTPTETPTVGPPPTPTPTATLVPGTTAVWIDPPSQEVAPGEYFSVDVVVQNVTNLGAYDFTLIYNPNIISFDSVSNLTFLGSTGRTVSCPPPVADGWVLRFGCVTTGLAIPGPSGSGQLAEIIFRAADPVPSPGWTVLELQDIGLADPLGGSIAAATAGGSVSVLAPTPTATATRTPTRTSTPAPTETYTPTPTSTDTDTPTPTETFTPTPTETYVPTPTPTETFTPTPTETFTPTPTETYTPTPTDAAIPTPTETFTPTPTETYLPTPTPTDTDTPTPTETFTPTPTETYTPTPTDAAIPTPTETFTPTPTETQTSISGATSGSDTTVIKLPAAAGLRAGSSPESSLAAAAGPVAMFANPAAADLWLCNQDDGSCEGEGQGHLTINQEVSGIPAGVGLGGFEFRIYYPRSLIDLSIREGPFLGSTGRDTQCWTIALENSYRFGCTSTGSEPGPHGSGVVAYLDAVPKADLRLRPTLRNGISLTLLNSAQEAELTNELGAPIHVDTTGNADVLIRALEGDLNYDCKVNVIDDQAVSGRYGTSFGIQPYDVFFDLEPQIPDQDIDIKDLQFVYGRDGTTCEGAEQPEPSPTPTATATATVEPATATPTPSGSETPTFTPGPESPTATYTPESPTATYTPSGGATATSTPTAGPSATPTASPTGGPPAPSATPRPHATHTKTPAPHDSPTPEAGTATPVPVVTATSTPPPAASVVPSEGTRGPTKQVAPEGRVREPGTAEELPGAGSGSTAGSSRSGLWLLIAGLGFAGWFIVTWMLYRSGGQFPTQPLTAENRRRNSPSRRAP